MYYVNLKGDTAFRTLCDFIQTLRHFIFLTAIHLPNIQNSTADLLSHTTLTKHKLSLSNSTLSLVFRHFGVPDTDAFTMPENTKCPTSSAGITQVIYDEESLSYTSGQVIYSTFFIHTHLYPGSWKKL